MDTAVRTPLAVFTLPQHLVVPLFQRPYVWDEENQWGPLWHDIRRLAEFQLANPGVPATHFLGAVVLQSLDSQVGRCRLGRSSTVSSASPRCSSSWTRPRRSSRLATWCI